MDSGRCQDPESRRGTTPEEPRESLACHELDYAGYGLVGGLAAASVLDALFLTTEEPAPATAGTLVPLAWATGEAAGAGVALTW